MAQLLVRNLEDRLVNRLKIRAREKGHSLQAEVKEILQQSVRWELNQLDPEEGRKLADAIRESIRNRIGGPLDDSALIIRKDRDSRVRRLDRIK